MGSKTLTALKRRKKIAIDSTSVVAKIAHHGNLIIPKNSYILSLPESYTSISFAINE
ncbi:MAG: hypothetical protein ACYC2U_01235 [Candidatus Amoebophilus sp.]